MTEVSSKTPMQDFGTGIPSKTPMQDPGVLDDVRELEPQGDNDSDDEAEDDDSNLDNESLEEDNGDAEPIEV